ncbi:MAG: Rv2175c family DNA-binding protein [bacterium]
MQTDVSSLDLLTLPDVAERLAIPITQVQQMVRDGHLVALRTDGVPPSVPAALLSDEGPVKGLSGVITLLRDARYTDAEIVDWLYRADDSLPGTPIEALRANRGTEVKRRAQAAGF